jgi:hypothetical protein
MRRPPKLPDLGKLTGTQKDELIVSLWETPAAIEGSGDASGAAVANQGPRSTSAPSTDDLRERIRQTPPSRRAQARLQNPARFGGGFDFLESKILLGLLVCDRSWLSSRFRRRLVSAAPP